MEKKIETEEEMEGTTKEDWIKLAKKEVQV